MSQFGRSFDDDATIIDCDVAGVVKVNRFGAGGGVGRSAGWRIGEPPIGILEREGLVCMCSIVEAASSRGSSVLERPITCWNRTKRSRRLKRSKSRVVLFQSLRRIVRPELDPMTHGMRHGVEFQIKCLFEAIFFPTRPLS